jgi:hypothetical protein
MVYLGITAFCAIGVLFWMLRHRPDPHHIFAISLLPLLDLEHTTGTATGLGKQALKRNSHTRAIA